MNANIYVLFKDGSYSKAFASVKKLVAEVSEMAGKEVTSSDIRKAIKTDGSYVLKENGLDLEIKHDLLF